MKIFTAPQHTRFVLPLFHPTKFNRLSCRAVLFFYGICELQTIRQIMIRRRPKV